VAVLEYWEGRREGIIKKDWQNESCGKLAYASVVFKGPLILTCGMA
jgi:hypothetical protein